MTVRRVVLWGFMASGKTAVGASVARRLAWRHLDLDAEVVRRTGCSIADTFRTHGELEFRRLEAEVTRQLISSERAVLSTGGGWVTNPEHRAGLPPGTLSVWLRAGPAALLARLRKDDGGIERPMLRSSDPASDVRRLLDAREPLYRGADLTIDTDTLDVEQVAERVLAELRRRGAAST